MVEKADLAASADHRRIISCGAATREVNVILWEGLLELMRVTT